MRVDLPLVVAFRFFNQELPRRAIFQEIEDAGLRVVDWGCQVRKFTDQDGEYGTGYHEYFIAFESDAQAVQFKLAFL